MGDPTIVGSDRAEIHMTAFMPKQSRAVTVPRSRCSSNSAVCSKVVWTLTANGKTTSIPMGLNPLYEVSPLAIHGKAQHRR